VKKNGLDRAEYTSNLVNDLRALIASTRDEVARSVNSALVLLYWRVGRRIRQDILKEKRAGIRGRNFADSVGKIGY